VLAACRLLYPARLRGRRCVARAHGVDLYAERAGLARLPHARLVLAACDAVHPCSHDGADYLCARYPEHASKISARYLGVRPQEQPAAPSRDGVLRVVSCSFMVPIKRLDRLAEAIALLPGRVCWTHLGDGPEREAVQRVAAGFGPDKELRAPGTLDNEAVLRFYAEQPVDVFANVSASEGLPVSIMEAMSFGIPVLATAVGGVPELVTPATGITIPADAPARAIAEALERVARARWDREAIQREQRHRFSTANYHAFAESLAEGSGGT
jgi:glycosyltransferase involved in cell wall biosynthesis